MNNRKGLSFSNINSTVNIQSNNKTLNLATTIFESFLIPLFPKLKRAFDFNKSLSNYLNTINYACIYVVLATINTISTNLIQPPLILH